MDPRIPRYPDAGDLSSNAHRPAPIAQDPSPIAQRPAPSADPSSNAHRPAPIAQDPSPIAQRPAPSADPSSNAYRPSPIAQEESPIAQLQWFAVWTRSRHEQVVREQLERKQFDAFLPTITKWSRWKDRKKKIDWPLFPGYCFVRFDPADTLPILKCTGVVSIVSFEGKPAAIPEYELDSIRVLVASELQFDPCPLIHEGMMVEVVSGPLRGVIGRLVRKDAPKARLVLSVDLIGQAVSVEVDAADVRAY